MTLFPRPTSDDPYLLALRAANELQASCRSIGYDLRVLPQLPHQGRPYVSLLAPTDEATRVVARLRRGSGVPDAGEFPPGSIAFPPCRCGHPKCPDYDEVGARLRAVHGRHTQ
ncbi:hypothetical protein ACIQGZ_25930 [Streptomyces sp. NPDC092296]|uniref:hypothetical protein n=1 Tax=Streptomyces sp. NPDC092296 TaxID=3366012 RepID=UPI0037F75588